MPFLTKFKKQTNFSTQVIIVIGIILVINFLSYQIFTRFDLTQNKVYSISKTSKNTVKNLDDLVNIKVYFSEQLPPQYISVRQEVTDILDEYKNYANNKIAVEFIDPKDDEELKTELMIMGIPQLQFNVLENDKYEVINGFLGIGVYYGDKKQAIPVIDNTQNLEYQLTSAIKKVTAEKIPTIGVATGYGEFDLSGAMSFIDKKIREVYDVQTVNLASGDNIPDDIDTLIIIGPKEVYSDRALFVVDQFLMKGKSVLIAIDGVTVGDGLSASVNPADLNTFLQASGINVIKNLVLDTSSEMASFNQGFVTFTSQYPYWVKITRDGFDQENAAVAKLQSLVLPWASEITVAEIKLPEAQVSYLAKSTTDAWRIQDQFNLAPQGTNFGYYEDPESYNLAVSVRGRLNSAFDSYVAKEGETGEVLSSTDNARLIVIGDADFATDGFIRRFPDNIVFFQNIIDTLTLDEDLINIRSKTVTDRPLKEIEDSTKTIIKFINIFGLTLAVLIIGLGRYFMRKRSRFADEL